MGYTIYAVNTLIVSIIFPLVAIAVVALRFTAHFKKSIPIRWDDSAIVVALLIAIASGILCIYGSVRGEIGVPIASLTPEAGVLLFKFLFAIILLHLSGLTFIKISILLFYKRIFVTKRFHMIANATIAFVVVWWLTFFIGLFFASTPISNFWDEHETDLNYNVGAFFMALACLDMTVDLWTLALPLPVISKLNMQKKRKWQLAGIFALGFFCVVASAVRIYYIYAVITLPSFTSPVFLYVLSNNFIWAVIEPCTSIVAACLPTLGPLVNSRGLEAIVRSVRSIFSLNSIRSGSGRSGRSARNAAAQGEAPAEGAGSGPWVKVGNQSETKSSEHVSTDIERDAEGQHELVGTKASAS